MARRKALKNVCSGILGSFVSRNNDCEGYWAMGILYRFAKERGKSDLTIDLMNRLHGSDKGGAPPELVGRRYGAMFQSQLIHAKIDPAKVTSAQIDVRFESSGNLPPPRQDTWGEPFACTITVTDDLGKAWRLSKVGVCGPHDSRRELRRLPTKWGAI